MRERLLVRHFLWRFLDHDLISPNTDRRVALSAIAGSALALSLFIAALIMLEYQFFTYMPPGMTSVRSLDDRFMFTSASMLVMALAAVAQWDALALDARDAAVLGVLPIRRAVLVRAKFLAVGLFAAAVLVGWNFFPIVLRGVSVPVALPLGIPGAFRLTLAQAVATLAAGWFGFLAVLGVRETALALLGGRRFQAISASLQAALIILLTTGWLLLPVNSSGVGRGWLASSGVAAKALPPLWFVGLHEVLAGSVIDDVPRTRTAPYMVVQEREATALYRQLWPRYRELAALAVFALLAATIVTVVACVWNSRRLPAAIHRHAPARTLFGQAWTWMVEHLVARHPLSQAGFFFACQTLFRRASHRVPMAAATAAGVSLMVLMTAGAAAWDGTDPRTIPLALLTAQSLMLASIVAGLRHATRVPAELRSSSSFSLAWRGDSTPYISGVKRAGWVAVILPVLAGLLMVHAALLGLSLALRHLGVGLCVSALLMETAFLRVHRVPFVSSYQPDEDAKSRAMLTIGAVLGVAFALGWAERWALETGAGYGLLIVGLTVTSAGLAVYRHATREPPVALDADDDALPMATVRLNLAG